MGALQTFHWGALYPTMMDLLAPFCGSAKCSRHNFVFLEGVAAALMADAAWNEGWYTQKPARGLRAQRPASMPAGVFPRPSIARSST